MSTREFKECAECAVKPGAPALCAACLNNRAVIYDLLAEAGKNAPAALMLVRQAQDSLARRVDALELLPPAPRAPHPPITGRGYTPGCPCADCRERELEALRARFDDLGKSHREMVDREIAYAQQAQALRTCVVYARDRRGHHFDYDSWIQMVEAALSQKGGVTPHALEEAQSELLHVQKVLDEVRKDRDRMQASLGKARSEVVGLIGERDKARAERDEAQSNIADMANREREAIVALRESNNFMQSLSGQHWPRVGKRGLGGYQLLGCKCGFETTSDDELVKHMATMKVADDIRVTKRANGAYTAGPPPDGRSVGEHLTELATGKNPPRCGLGDFDGGCVLLSGHAGAHVGYAVDKNDATTFTIHESVGVHPDATLEVIDEATHFRVRVREPRAGKASIFLTPQELEKLQLNIGFIRGRRVGQRQPPIVQPGAKYTGIFKEHDTLARYILLNWLPSRNRGELFTAILKMEDMNLATDELALILQHQGIPPNWAPGAITPAICRWTRNKVIDCKYCQARACSQHPDCEQVVADAHRRVMPQKEFEAALEKVCQCNDEERHAALPYEHDDLTSVDLYDTLTRVYCQRAGQVLHHGCGWCAEHNRPAFECQCNGPRVAVRAFGDRVIGHRDRVPRCEVADCKAVVCHGEHWYDKLRWWCHQHVPWSGHHEHCPEPCRALVKGVTFQEVFTDLARSHEHLRKP